MPPSSDPARKASQGWTVETAMAHLESAVESLGKRMDDRFSAQEKAIDTAMKAATLSADKEAINAEKWRASTNEWREAMNDREIRFVSKDELNPKLKNLEDKIDQLQATRDRNEGWGKGLGAGWGVLITVMTVLFLGGAVWVGALALRH